jgi:hypothetical protein
MAGKCGDEFPLTSRLQVPRPSGWSVDRVHRLLNITKTYLEGSARHAQMIAVCLAGKDPLHTPGLHCRVQHVAVGAALD